jgi:hypothetical protein
MTSISFIHSGYPKDCASINLIVEPGLEQFPQRSGTGFFVKRGKKLYYLTARHCLTKNQFDDISKIAAKLHVSFYLQGRTTTSADYVSFSEAISLKHDSEEIPGVLIDLVVLSIDLPSREKDRKHLLSRAVKMPPTGEWLDAFMAQDLAQSAIKAGEGITLSGIGYPYDGTATNIDYPEMPSQPIEIVTQQAKFTGHLAEGYSPDRAMLQNVTWDRDLNGFSGSPVFIGFKNRNGRQYALAGMLVTGGNGKAQFIKIGIIMSAFEI